MKNLGVLLRLARSITPELDTKAVGDEIRERIVEELDYELEASNQRTMARLYAATRSSLVPEVVTSLCRERVIVTEFVDRRRIRGAARRAPAPSATGSARSSSASTSAPCTATAASPATRTRAT